MKKNKEIIEFINRKIDKCRSDIKAESNPILKTVIIQLAEELTTIKNFINEVPTLTLTPDGGRWIDLGLPSGRLWAAENKPGYHQFDKAIEKFGDQLPSIEAWKELFKKCDHTWDKKRKGYLLTGPNGNTLFLPAKGLNDYDLNTKKLIRGGVLGVGGFGLYWSSPPDGVNLARFVFFGSGYIGPQSRNYRLNGFSVRLTREPK